jgi:hypothetical protein
MVGITIASFPLLLKKLCIFMCSQHNMAKFITHEPIASQWLNINFSTGTGALQPWHRQLSNTEQLVCLLVDRMEKDYLALSPKMRRPWGKDVESRK